MPTKAADKTAKAIEIFIASCSDGLKEGDDDKLILKWYQRRVLSCTTNARKREFSISYDRERENAQKPVSSQQKNNRTRMI